MPPKCELKQEDFMYGLEWDATVDNMFIDVLLNEVLLGNFNPKEPGAHSLLVAKDVLNKILHKSFSFNECAAQVKKLNKRHSVFKWLLNCNGVYHDLATNTVHAADFVWEDIFQKKSFAYVYQTCGDPNWDDLQIIFALGPNAVTNVVQISSSEEDADEDEYEDADHGIMPQLHPEVINIPSSSDSSKANSFWNYVGGHASDSPSEESFNNSSLNSDANTARGLRGCYKHLPKADSPSPGPSSCDIPPSSSASCSPWKKL